jgi:anti-anti-sigma regulatory factor
VERELPGIVAFRERPTSRRDLHPRTPFALHVVRGEKTALLIAIGEMRQQQAETVRRCVGALAGRGARIVVVDMSRVDFLSPAGRRALVAIAADVPETEVFLAGLGGDAHRQLAQRHARTRIRTPRVRCRTCAPLPRFTLPRRW